MKDWRYGLSVGLVCVLAACGGASTNTVDVASGGSTDSSGSGVTPSPDAATLSISGTAATGLAIAGGTVTARCNNGTITTTTKNNGTFTFKLPKGAAGPCMMKVESGSTVLYSAAHATQTIANITPLTNLIVANALGGEPASAFEAAASGSAPAALSEKNLNSAKVVVASALNAIGVSLPDGQDPLAQSFQAMTGSTAGDALDVALDKLALTLANSNVTVEKLSTALKTATPADAGTKVQTAAPSGSVIVPYVDTPYTSVPSTAVEVALAGNAYVTQAAAKGTEKVDYNVTPTTGITNWTSPDAVMSAFVYIKNPGMLEIGVDGNLESAGSSVIKVSARGKSFNVTLNSTTQSKIPAGVIAVPTAGYIKIDLQGVSKTTAKFGNLKNLQLSGPASVGMVYAKTTDSMGYYWMRRGASNYIRYASTPKDAKFFYNEVTIPKGFDPVSSYFEVNGFVKGYFGLQVKDTERWVIFSLWDPTNCDRTATPIDNTKCTSLVSYGPKVTAKTFGGEGTGGQSYLVYPWVAGTTYKFVTQAEVVGTDTLYSSWFYAPEDDKWYYLATFKYPGEALGMTGLYSFDECFNPAHSYLPRKMILTNQFTSPDGNTWNEVRNASYDATTEGSERWDVAGGLADSPTGSAKSAFYLIQGGFFNNDGSFNSVASSQMRVPSPSPNLLRNSIGNVTPDTLRAIVPLLVKQ